MRIQAMPMPSSRGFQSQQKRYFFPTEVQAGNYGGIATLPVGDLRFGGWQRLGWGKLGVAAACVTSMLLGTLAGNLGSTMWTNSRIQGLAAEARRIETEAARLSALRRDWSRIAPRVVTANVSLMEQDNKLVGAGTWIRDQEGNLYILTSASVVQKRLADPEPPGELTAVLYTGDEYATPHRIPVTPVRLPNGEFAVSPADQYNLALLKVAQANFMLPHGIYPVQRLRDVVLNPLDQGEPLLVVTSQHRYPDMVIQGNVSHLNRRLDKRDGRFIGVAAPINFKFGEYERIFISPFFISYPLKDSWEGATFDAEGNLVTLVTSMVHMSEDLSFGIHPYELRRLLAQWNVQLEQG